MKYSKKILSTITSIAIISQILPITPITIDAQQVTNNTVQQITNNTNSIQTQDKNLETGITVNGLFTKEVQAQNYINDITLMGSTSQGTTNQFKVKFNTQEKKLKIKDMCGNDTNINPSFNDKKYISLILFDQDRNIKKIVSIKGNENVSKANELNDVEFEYGDRFKIYHAEANSLVKISGDVIDQTENFNTGASKDVLAEYDFEITELGLKQVKAIKYTLNNKITLSGIGCQESPGEGGYHKFELSLDPETKKLKVNNLVGLYRNHPFHPHFPNEYINIKLLDKDGNVKKELSMTGNENVKKAQDVLNDVDFKYGDRLRIFHDEADWRTKIAGNVNDTEGESIDLSNRTSKDVLSSYDFKITESGLQLVPAFTNELNKTKITLMGLGDCPESPSQGPYHKFELKLDPLTKKLKVDNLVGLHGYGNHDFHPYFKNEYINVTLLDEYGNVKKELSLKGTDNVQKAKDVLNDVEFEYGDRLSFFHEEADWRTQITGNIYQVSGEKVNLSERTSKDILNNYDFEITKSGLQEVPAFTNGLDRTKITLSGVGCQEGTHKFDLSLDPETKKLKVDGLEGLYNNHPFHPYFKDNEYINIKLIDEDGNVKKELSLTGNENVQKAQDVLNDVDFKYGDRLRIFHVEASWRTKIDGNVYQVSGSLTNDYTNGTSKTILSTYDFMITRSGLQLVSPFTNGLNNKITLAGAGCQEGIHRFDLSLDSETKKLKVNILNGLGDGQTHPFHPYFGDNEYINVTLLDEYGNVKKELSLTGNENVKEVQDMLNNIDFEYGDSLSIYHDEADWRTQITGNVTSTERNTVDLSERTSKTILNRYNFRITKSGLQEIYKNRYYPFIIKNK